MHRSLGRAPSEELLAGGRIEISGRLHRDAVGVGRERAKILGIGAQHYAVGLSCGDDNGVHGRDL